MEVKNSRLELIVEQMAETVIATSETVDRLAEQIDALTDRLHQQAQQVQQQGYQIMALSNAVQTLAENQDQHLERLNYITDTLQILMSQQTENHNHRS